MRYWTIRTFIPFLIGSAVRLWMKTFPVQSGYASSREITSGRWKFVFHLFPETIQAGFLARGENIGIATEAEEVEGWTLIYRREAEPGDFRDSGVGTQFSSAVGFKELPENHIFLLGFPQHFKGIWIATHPWIKRVVISPVPNESDRVLGLRMAAGILGDKACKPGNRLVRWAVTTFEDRPAADRLCALVAHRVQHDASRRRPITKPPVKLGTGNAYQRFLDWRKEWGA